MADRAKSDRRSDNKKTQRQMVIGPFRMAWPALFEPEEDDYGNERFKVTCLFPPGYNIKPLEDAIWDAWEEAYGTDKSKWPSGKNDVWPGEKLQDAGKKDYQGFKDGWKYTTITSKDPPGIVDSNREEVLSKREVYGGRWARAQVNIAAYDNKSRGVGIYMNHIQLLEHDEAFSGKGNPQDAFDKYELKDEGQSRDRNSRGGRDDGRENDRRNSRDDERGNSRRDNDDGGRRDDRGRDDRGSSRRDDRERDDRGREDRDREPARGRDDDRGSRGRDRDEGRSSRDREPERDDRREDRDAGRGGRDRSGERSASRDDRERDARGGDRDRERPSDRDRRGGANDRSRSRDDEWN
jgi:hypothetical protein